MAASMSSHSIRSFSSPSALSKALFLRHCFRLLQEPIIAHFSFSTPCSRQSPWACSGRTRYIQRRAGCQARQQARALRSHMVSHGPGKCCRTSGRGGREPSSFSCTFLSLVFCVPCLHALRMEFAQHTEDLFRAAVCGRCLNNQRAATLRAGCRDNRCFFHACSSFCSFRRKSQRSIFGSAYSPHSLINSW